MSSMWVGVVCGCVYTKTLFIFNLSLGISPSKAIAIEFLLKLKNKNRKKTIFSPMYYNNNQKYHKYSVQNMFIVHIELLPRAKLSQVKYV